MASYWSACFIHSSAGFTRGLLAAKDISEDTYILVVGISGLRSSPSGLCIPCRLYRKGPCLLLSPRFVVQHFLRDSFHRHGCHALSRTLPTSFYETVPYIQRSRSVLHWHSLPYSITREYWVSNLWCSSMPFFLSISQRRGQRHLLSKSSIAWLYFHTLQAPPPWTYILGS